MVTPDRPLDKQGRSNTGGEFACFVRLSSSSRILWTVIDSVVQVHWCAYACASLWTYRQRVVIEASEARSCSTWCVVYRGIGRKVADCIALYSLGCFSRWPLDTHMITHAALDPCLRLFLEDFMQHQQKEHGVRERKTKEPNNKIAHPTLEFQSHEGRTEFSRPAAGDLLHFTLSPAALRSFLSARSQKKGVEIVKSVNLSDGLYYLIQGFYQRQLGLYAGWAQSGIFANAVGSL